MGSLVYTKMLTLALYLILGHWCLETHQQLMVMVLCVSGALMTTQAAYADVTTAVPKFQKFSHWLWPKPILFFL